MGANLAKQITIRLTVEDHEKWKAQAEEAGITLGTLIRLRMYGLEVVKTTRAA